MNKTVVFLRDGSGSMMGEFDRRVQTLERLVLAKTVIVGQTFYSMTFGGSRQHILIGPISPSMNCFPAEYWTSQDGMNFGGPGDPWSAVDHALDLAQDQTGKVQIILATDEPIVLIPADMKVRLNEAGDRIALDLLLVCDNGPSTWSVPDYFNEVWYVRNLLADSAQVLGMLSTIAKKGRDG